MSYYDTDVSTPMQISSASRVTPRILDADEIKSAVQQYDQISQLEIISEMFCSYTRSQGVAVSSDFLSLFIRASHHLKSCNRINVVYGLAKVIGTLRPDRTDSLMPAKRMPMGLVEYLVQFFSADNLIKVSYCLHAMNCICSNNKFL